MSKFSWVYFAKENIYSISQALGINPWTWTNTYTNQKANSKHFCCGVYLVAQETLQHTCLQPNTCQYIFNLSSDQHPGIFRSGFFQSKLVSQMPLLEKSHHFVNCFLTYISLQGDFPNQVEGIMITLSAIMSLNNNSLYRKILVFHFLIIIPF